MRYSFIWLCTTKLFHYLTKLIGSRLIPKQNSVPRCVLSIAVDYIASLCVSVDVWELILQCIRTTEHESPLNFPEPLKASANIGENPRERPNRIPPPDRFETNDRGGPWTVWGLSETRTGRRSVLGKISVRFRFRRRYWSNANRRGLH